MLENVAMLITTGNRSKAYLQAMRKNNLLPGLCIIMTPEIEKLKEETNNFNKTEDHNEYFDINETVLWTINSMNVPYVIIETNSINTDRIIELLQAITQEYIVVSGFAGEILKNPLFSLNKKFIHVHPGKIPEFRGSTTVYYSLLESNTCWATAFILDEKIDTGDVILMKEFKVSKATPNIDTIFDSYIRSEVLVEVLSYYQSNKVFNTIQQNPLEGETYFIIHPVLKHLAIMGIK